MVAQLKQLKFEDLAHEKNVAFVDLVKSFPTSIWSRNLASILNHLLELRLFSQPASRTNVLDTVFSYRAFLSCSYKKGQELDY